MKSTKYRQPHYFVRRTIIFFWVQLRLTLMPWTGLDDIQFTFDELILLRFLDNYYVALTMNNGYFTLINYFGRDSPRADLPRSTTSNGQVRSVIGNRKHRITEAPKSWTVGSSDRQSSSVVVYGVCSRVFLVIHADWVSNSVLFDLNLAISNSMIFWFPVQRRFYNFNYDK